MTGEKSKMPVINRVVLSVIALAAAAAVRWVLVPVSMLGAGQVAGLQLTNSDPNAVISMSGMHFFSGIGAWTAMALLLTLLAIWWGPLCRACRFLVKELLAMAVLLVVCSPAHAYWSTTNVTEAYGILPNHTAFWVPGTGDTKNNQAQMETEEFYNQNKVPGKFFVIPHVKLSGSVYIGWDYYIPAGRLIVVDRTPYFHEWTRKGRGTDAGLDTSFPCHSKDNIEVTAEMSLAASVTESNAAKFLYYFGVNQPAGDPTAPAVIFTSVFEGRSLAQVMSTWGRGEIQSRVCRHILEHTVEDLALNGNAVLTTIQDEARKFFGEFGITIEYIGWAGGFGYPAEVSNAINTRFAAEHIEPVLSVLETKARIDAFSGWDRHLPSSLTLLLGGGGLLSDIIGGVKAATPGTAK